MNHPPLRAVHALAILAAVVATPDKIGAAEAGGAAGTSEGDAVAICTDLRRAGLLHRDQGLRLTRPAESITLADVVMAVCGSLGPSTSRAPQSLRELTTLRMQAAMHQGLVSLTLADIVRDARCLRLAGADEASTFGVCAAS